MKGVTKGGPRGALARPQRASTRAGSARGRHTLCMVFPGGEPPLEPPEPPRQIDAYAHIEHMVGDEWELLETAADKRTPHQHERLRAIEAELDRIWHALQARAERRSGAR
jgi:hypothetical protein